MIYMTSPTIILLKEMLKGLKSSRKQQPEDTASRVRSSVNEHRIKSAEMQSDNSQDENIEARIKQAEDSSLLSKYNSCLELFLKGKAEDAQLKIQQLKELHLQASQMPQTSKAQRGKFDYSMDFEGDEGKEKVKKAIKKRNRPIMASNRVQDYCMFCPDNEDLTLLSASNYVYLALPKFKTFQNLFHLILAPVDHEQTSIGLNEDIQTELNNYKKCLIQAFDKYDLQAVFFEQFSKDNSHIYLECLAVPSKKGMDLPFFFKQALESIEGNWTTHRSIIKIEKEKGGIQKQIPKPIKYFYIDFSDGHGYAHVIENEKFWKREFCYQILATALNMEMHKVKTTEPFSPEEEDRKRETFLKIWKPFDWTTLI